MKTRFFGFVLIRALLSSVFSAIKNPRSLYPVVDESKTEDHGEEDECKRWCIAITHLVEELRKNEYAEGIRGAERQLMPHHPDVAKSLERTNNGD